MVTCENIVNWYRQRDASKNYAAWIDEHPSEAAALDYSLKLALEFGMIPNGN
jgi:hypothetical protein